MKALLIIGALFVGVVALGVTSYIGAYNSGNVLENSIKAQYSQNQNKLSEMTSSIMEAAQVPAMARDDLEKVIKAGLEGRYGEGGSGALLQAMTEAYPGQLDSALYSKLQQMIESRRRDFSEEQKLLIEKKRAYEVALGYFWGGMWMKVAGYPKIDLAEYTIVTNAETQEIFKTKTDKTMQLR